jgi:hypothetical protein
MLPAADEAGEAIMVDNPIQQGNWFSHLRAWRASRTREAARPRRGGGERAASGSTPPPASEVDLGRLAMAAPLEE